MNPGSRPQLQIGHPFRPRPVDFIELWEWGAWRMKVYGLHAEHQRLLPELLARAKELAARTLPESPAQANAYGVGFIGVHAGRDANFVFVDWWSNENELNHHVFTSSLDEPLQLGPAPNGLAACVFDLQVIWFERNAWIDRVLANPRGPDLEAYLKRVISDQA